MSLNLNALNSWSYCVFEWKSVVSWNQYDRVFLMLIYTTFRFWNYEYLKLSTLQFWEFLLSIFKTFHCFSVNHWDQKDLNAPFVRTISKDDLQERVFATQVKKDTILFAYTSHAKLMKGIRWSHLCSLAFFINIKNLSYFLEILNIPKAQQFMVIGNCSFNRFEDDYPNLMVEGK